MDSPILKKIKQLNPDINYPLKMGQKWTNEEDNLLLEELSKNMNIDIISQSHQRTIGGIVGRQRTIAYNMHLSNYTIDEIILKTKLNKEEITETITKKEIKIQKTKKIDQLNLLSLENEVIAMKFEIKELKNMIKELVEMTKAVYDFEDT
jgi:hypothetical protein